MLGGMGFSRDASPSGSPVRHLHAVEAGFLRTDRRADEHDPPELAGDDFTRRQLDLFGHLIEAVGDADALWRLDVKPLPDEPFDWSAVQPEDKEFVAEVLALSDHCCDEAFDFEFRTAARRILARVARNVPDRSAAIDTRHGARRRWCGWSDRPTATSDVVADCRRRCSGGGSALATAKGGRTRCVVRRASNPRIDMDGTTR